MTPQHGATRAHCAAEVKRLSARYPDLKGDAGRFTEVFRSWAVNNRHATEIADAILASGKSPNKITIRNTAERLRARGPVRCEKCSNTGFQVVERNGVSGAQPCECRQPKPAPQPGLFDGGAA